MSTTIGCPIPGASQPKEQVRLIDIKEILQYDGAHFTWSGGRNCITEQKAAYARGYDAGMKFVVDEAKKASTIDPESLRPTAEWISVKDRLPAKHVKVIAAVKTSFGHAICMASLECDGSWEESTFFETYGEMRFEEEPVVAWMPLPKPPEVTP